MRCILTGQTYGAIGGAYSGNGDAFLTKYDVTGVLIWSRQLGTTSSENSHGVAADQSGNVYITGSTSGNLAAPNPTLADPFLSKYDAAGNLIWTKQIGSTSEDASVSVTLDGSGNAYITGYTNGSLAGPYAGSTDAFVSKYDPAGNVLWSKQFGTFGTDQATAISANQLGDLFVGGITNGPLAGPDTGNDLNSHISKYDQSGNLVWIKQFGTSQDDIINGLVADAAGNVFAVGTTTGALAGTNSGDNDDVFLVKYDPAGTLLWTKQLGTNALDRGFDVVTDLNGNVFITGSSTGAISGSSFGSSDVFLNKYDTAGNLLWSKQFGTSTSDAGRGLSSDELGNIYLTGYTFGELGGPNSGMQDAFLVRFTAIPEPSSILFGSLCSGFSLLLVRCCRTGKKHVLK